MNKHNEFTHAEAVLQGQFSEHPNFFWAKKSDHFVHLPADHGPGTCCGSHAALLGNNYAPYMPDAKVCKACVERAIESGHSYLN